MSDETRLWYGFTDAEIKEKLKRESPEYKAQQEREGREVETSRWERFKAKVRREEAEKAQQRRQDAETIASMSPEGLAHHYAKQARATPDLAPVPLQKGYTIALQDLRSEELREARVAQTAAVRTASMLKRFISVSS